jgi:hypothetical protein
MAHGSSTTERLSIVAGNVQHSAIVLTSLFLVAHLCACEHNPCVNGQAIGDDKDEDAVPDCLEDGIDYDNDGKVDFTTSTSTEHKDIFVKIDWMECGESVEGSCSDSHSEKPDDNAWRDVMMAFDRAPVENKNGQNGIRLHVEFGEEPLPHAETSIVITCET